MNPKTKIIALLSDFGENDHYVGAMKGVISSISPRATIVDICHSIEPQDVNAGAYMLWAAYSFFPKGTIFVSVVDPGVGGDRDVICVKTRRHVFLAPDNGILKFILAEEEHPNAVSVRNRRLFLPQVSNTFHGRDIFAPVSAHLANGVSVSRLGPAVKPATEIGHFVNLDLGGRHRVTGSIIHIDRFGNLITNIRINRAEKNAGEIELVLEGNIFFKRKITTYSPTYIAAPDRIPFFTVGSNGLLEISVKNGSASKHLSAEVGTRIEVLPNNAA